jgi:peptidoglycan/LPS O-acetylase OafA/YrhL
MWGIFAANGYYGLWLTSAGTAMVIWSCVQRGSWPTRILGNRWVEYGGRISFSFYLLQEHFYLLKLRGGVMDFFGFDADTILEFNPLLALAMLAAMIVAATLVYELVEKPAHRWLKGNEAPRRDPAAAPPAPPAAAA